MSTVATYSYTHSVTYVTDNILKSLKDIILLSGLGPEHFADRWESNTRAIKTWLGTGDLRKVILEIYNPATDKLVTRWDIDIVYLHQAGDMLRSDEGSRRCADECVGGTVSYSCAKY